jgi:hypothetical protein
MRRDSTISAPADDRCSACDRHCGCRANRVYGPRGQHARGTRPRLSARKLASRGHPRHHWRLLRGLALVRRDRAAQPRLGVLRLPELSVPGAHGHDPRCGTRARLGARSVLARRVLGQLLPQSAVLRAALALGASAAAALSAPYVSAAVGSVATPRRAAAAFDRARASTADPAFAAHDPAGSLATRCGTATDAASSADGASGGARAGTDAAFTPTRDAVAGPAALLGAYECSAC